MPLRAHKIKEMGEIRRLERTGNTYCSICDNEKDCVILQNDEYDENYHFIIICTDCLKEAIRELESK